jgi:pimeloyl-ACP methyl ester carboxylesterase
MPYQLPPDPSTARRARVTEWVTFGFAALLVALVAYFGYVGYEGSRQFTEAPAPSTDCRTPATMGWDYEAVNYDRNGDAALAAEPDPRSCTVLGAPAGHEVTGPGGIGLAGWYVPAGNGDPDAVTVVIAHGWGSSKHDMLDRAAFLHEQYDLLLPDLRNHGQSGDAATTQGVREAGDLRAMIDWLEATKAPERIAVLGVSMGGATALAEADRDERVDALIVESTHATLTSAITARLDRAGYPLSLPASWAVLLGSLIRTGEDASSVDPIGSIGRLDERPVLLVYGGRDDTFGPHDGEQMRAAAQAARSSVSLEVCAEAGHAQSFDACSEDYPDWVLGFLEHALVPDG